ncbi:MAG: hypothetical protein ABIP21_01205, partial [Acidimicrobiia bacterium]
VEAFAPRPAGGVVRTQYLEIPDAGSVAFIGSRPTWLWGVEHGLNEHGVAIGNEKIWTTGRPHDRAPALLGMDLVRLGLERARTADDALAVMTELIENYGQGGSGEQDTVEPYDSSFLIADAHGGWIVETCDRTWVAKPVTTGAAISNRISIEREWTQAAPDVPAGANFQSWRHPRTPTTIADHRLTATRACVQRSDLSASALVATLRDHGDGPWGAPLEAEGVPSPVPIEPGDDHRGVTVCMHVRAHQATTASMVCVVDPNPDRATRAYVALGSPCVSVYVPVFPAVGVPAALSDPRTWSRFAAARDRVEAAPDALAATRAVFRPVEGDLWARADAIEAADLTAMLRFTATAFESVDAVLTELSL